MSNYVDALGAKDLNERKWIQTWNRGKQAEA